MARKTVNLAKLVERGNFFLLNSDDELVDQRKGVASMIEQALFLANAYKGFGYVTPSDRDKSEDSKLSIGIRFQPGSDTPEFPDDSRRHYYVGS